MEVRTSRLTLVLEQLVVFLTFTLVFLENFLNPSVRLSLPLFFLLFVVITISPREWWLLLCQQFLPPLSLHIQDVSFRKHELIPPIWLLFAFIQLYWAWSYLLPLLEQLKLRGRKYETENYRHLYVCSFPFVFCFGKKIWFIFFTPQRFQSCLLIGQEWVMPRLFDMLFKTKICCSKLPEEYTWLGEKCFIFSYSICPDNCLFLSAVVVKAHKHCFKCLAVVRTLCLFSDNHALCAHPFWGRLQIYTGSPMLGKPLTTPPPTAVSNCHYYCVR